MRRFAKPRVVVSRCLGFERCRYNGDIIQDAFVRKLEPHVEFLPVCPEVEIGLGTPRDPIRLVAGGGDALRLLQPTTGLDVTGRMNAWSDRFLGALADVDGFLLKSRSPSCGPGDVRVYSSGEKGPAVGKAAGLFAGAVKARFPGCAVEDEGRLNNFRIREHFLTQLFAFAGLRELLESPTAKGLVEFHATHKLLLLAMNQSKMRELGRIVAGHGKGKLPAMMAAYREGFHAALARIPRERSNLNVLQHAMGYFKDRLAAREKAHFLRTMERYENAKIPLSACLSLLRGWIERFEEPYLASQVWFEPYPEDLVEITDSGKGRE